MSEELVKILLCTLHYDIGILFLIVLISFNFSDQIAVILDNPLALLGYLLHVGDFLKKVLILIVIFDLDLFKGVGLILDGCGVDMRVASPQLLLHLDVGNTVVSLQDGVVGKKIKHLINSLSK